jgi:membrane associated rhomboid family serine protease
LIPFSDADVRRTSFPIVNGILIGLNTLVFLYELQLGGLGLLVGSSSSDINSFFFKWGFIPEELTQGEPFTRLRVGPFSQINIESPIPTWATIFSSMFVHGGLMHFVGNMMFLWVFGDNIEDWMGHIKYLLFYLLTGVAATLSHYAVSAHSQVPLVGASGAISGVMGGYLLLYPYNRVNVLVIFILITVVQLPAMIMLGLWFLLQLFNAFISLGISSQIEVAFFAHIGGFVAGMLIIAIYKLLTNQPIWPPRRRPPPWEYWYRSRRPWG